MGIISMQTTVTTVHDLVNKVLWSIYLFLLLYIFSHFPHRIRHIYTAISKFIEMCMKYFSTAVAGLLFWTTFPNQNGCTKLIHKWNFNFFSETLVKKEQISVNNSGVENWNYDVHGFPWFDENSDPFLFWLGILSTNLANQIFVLVFQ